MDDLQGIGFALLAAGLLFLIVRALARAGKRAAALAKEREEREAQELTLRIAEPLAPVQPSQALLKPKENAYVALPGALRELKTTGWQSGSRGASVRVAKGLSLRVGNTRGHAIKSVVTTSTGELVLTEKRILFAGHNKSFAINLVDLMNVNLEGLGIVVSNGRSTYHVTFAGRVDLLFFMDRLQKVRERLAA